MSNDVFETDPLFGGGAQAFQFNTFEPTPDVCRGIVLKIERRQQTDFDGKPMSWPDGRERKITIITVQTELREGSNDNGERTLWVKGGRYEVAKGDGQSMQDAIVEAARAVGVTSTEAMIGGELAVAYTGEGKATQRGYNPPKLYAASFKKAAPAPSDLFGDTPEPAPRVQPAGAAAVQDPF